MKLCELLSGVGVVKTNANLEMEISSVAYDSRKVTPGCLFVAVTGFATDGNKYIPMALEKGAVAVITAKEQDPSVPYVQVESDRLALALISSNYFGNPAASMQMIGVTGTNGKTSSTLLLKHVLQTVLDAKVGLIGTMENMIGHTSIPTERTTPESYELQALLAQMRDAGCTHVIMEVSSHAIALERVGGMHFAVAAFTNLTEDHLDFHKTMDAYCDAKALLMGRCDHAVVNGDDAYAPRMLAAVSSDAITTGVHGDADLKAEELELLSDKIRFLAVHSGEKTVVELPIPGRFTVYNALTVLAVAKCLGIPVAESAAALRTATGVKGRIEVVPTPGTDYTVLIDYAHTPDGLENVLRSVRDFCKGRTLPFC